MNPILPIEYLAPALAAFMAFAVYASLRTTAGMRRGPRLFAASARALGALCLAAAALNPGRWETLTEGRPAEWAILADRSASMNVTDAGSRTRWEAARELALSAAALAGRNGEARIFTFANTLETSSPKTIRDAGPEGESTDITGAARSLLAANRSSGRQLLGMLLISDGRQTAPESLDDLALRAHARQCPIFALPLGGEVARKDLFLKTPRKHYSSSVGRKVRIAATAGNAGIVNASPFLKFLDANGTELDSRRLSLAAGATETVHFEVTPAAPGHKDYVLALDEWEGEDTTANNRATVGVSALESRMRVLFAEGVPYWDSKFLVQLLRKQPNMEVTSVYRLSSERFFRVDTDLSDVTESMASIFPDNIEAMSKYDLAIIGKGAEYFLTPARIGALRRFAAELGGCVVFCRGKPYGGSLPELEALEPVEWADSVDGEFRLAPTRDGEEEGLFGDALPSRDDPVWTRLPMLRSANYCGRTKAFSTVLAEGVIESAGRSRSFPAVVSKRYGKGLAVVFNADGLWEWDFFPAAGETGETYRELWIQLIQWAAAHSEFLPGQEYSLRLSDTSVMPGSPVRVRVSSRSQAGTRPSPAAVVSRGGTVVRELALSESGPNRWETLCSFDEPGDYLLTLKPQAGGEPVSGPGAALQVRRPASERDDLSADREFMRRLAESSGGRLMEPDEVKESFFARPTAARNALGTKTVWIPFWDKWWILLTGIFMFGTEWFTRRRNGLL